MYFFIILREAESIRIRIQATTKFNNEGEDDNLANYVKLADISHH